MNPDAKYYEMLYNDPELKYGDSEHGTCPAMNMRKHTVEWLKPPVVDLGCGRGQYVEYLRARGWKATGMDWIEYNPKMEVRDIAQPLLLGGFKSAHCIDVFEHIDDNGVTEILLNMIVTKRQAISVFCGPSSRGKGVELHINIKTPIDWAIKIAHYLDIHDIIQVNKKQYLFLTKQKDEDSLG